MTLHVKRYQFDLLIKGVLQHVMEYISSSSRITDTKIAFWDKVINKTCFDRIWQTIAFGIDYFGLVIGDPTHFRNSYSRTLMKREALGSFLHF